MTCELIVQRIGPGSSIQDQGRPGQIGLGLSRGGAADGRAVIEGAVLLGQSEDKACLELAGVGGEFEATEDIRIALTGAPMRTQIDGVQAAWNASHLLARGARLSIGGAKEGRYGYLHLGGGIECRAHLGSRSAHLAAGLQTPVEVGDRLPVGPDAQGAETGFALPKDYRFEGGEIRVAASLQTHLFEDDVIARFQSTEFTVSSRSNRMGVALIGLDTSFLRSADGLNVISETVVPGDIQITGDGTPVVLLGECQTTGGYPRIGSVLPCDLAKVAQASQGTILRFRLIELEQATAIELAARQARAELHEALQALIRDPRTIPNLLSFQLISGVSAGTELSH